MYINLSKIKHNRIKVANGDNCFSNGTDLHLTKKKKISSQLNNLNY